MELRDRNIVITGAGSGIGRALAERFAAERPRALVLADVNGEAVREVARSLGEPAIGLEVDVGREEEILGLVDAARRAGGAIDLFCSTPAWPARPADRRPPSGSGSGP